MPSSPARRVSRWRSSHRRRRASVETVTFAVDGRLACTVERPPFGCDWDPGDIVRGHHVRVVATLADGRRLTDNLHTKDLGFTEHVPHRGRPRAGDRDAGRPVRARVEGAGFRDSGGRREAVHREPRERGRAARSRARDRRQRKHGAIARPGEGGGQAASVEAPPRRRGHARRVQRHVVPRDGAREGSEGARARRRSAERPGEAPRSTTRRCAPSIWSAASGAARASSSSRMATTATA